MSDPIDWKHLADFIRTRLSIDPDRPVLRDTPLFTSGLVDSFSVVELVHHIEKTYGVRIPSSSMVIDHFDTVRDLVKLLDSLRS